MLATAFCAAATLALLREFAFLCEHREKATYFTRSTAKLRFDELVRYVLSAPKASAQLAINSFLGACGMEREMTKQGIMQARRKVSRTAFRAICNDLARNAYSDGEYMRFKGMRVAAVDGSIFSLPSAKSNDFGLTRVGEDAETPQARALAMVDVLNGLILGADLYETDVGEREIAGDLIEGMKAEGIVRDGDVYLHDRGFASFELAERYERLGIKYVFRLKAHFSKATDAATEPDQTVTLRRGAGELNVRVVRVEIPGGSETLMTNLFGEGMTREDFAELYRLRWGVETSFRQLKDQLDIEDFSSADCNIVWQDFFASVYLANMAALAKIEAQAKVDERDAAAGKKYEYKINNNIAIGVVRPVLVQALASESQPERERLFNKAIAMLTKSVIPIRPGRSFTRERKYPSVKFPLNQKNNR